MLIILQAPGRGSVRDCKSACTAQDYLPMCGLQVHLCALLKKHPTQHVLPLHHCIRTVSMGYLINAIRDSI